LPSAATGAGQPPRPRRRRGHARLAAIARSRRVGGPAARPGRHRPGHRQADPGLVVRPDAPRTGRDRAVASKEHHVGSPWVIDAC